MKCENKNCTNDHDGSFGSGRFCSRQCANSRNFSSSSRQKKSISNKKRIKEFGEWGFLKDENRNCERSLDSIRMHQETCYNRLMCSDFSSLSNDLKRKRVILEQENKCSRCNLDTWMDEPISLELEHIDGTHEHNARENLIALCPNCHSLTATWRGRNAKKYSEKITDADLKVAFYKEGNIRRALISLGMAAKGSNYERMRRILID